MRFFSGSTYFFWVTTMHSVIKIRYRLIVIYVIVLKILLYTRVLETSDIGYFFSAILISDRRIQI